MLVAGINFNLDCDYGGASGVDDCCESVGGVGSVCFCARACACALS